MYRWLNEIRSGLQKDIDEMKKNIKATLDHLEPLQADFDAKNKAVDDAAPANQMQLLDVAEIAEKAVRDFENAHSKELQPLKDKGCYFNANRVDTKTVSLYRFGLCGNNNP